MGAGRVRSRGGSGRYPSRRWLDRAILGGPTIVDREEEGEMADGMTDLGTFDIERSTDPRVRRGLAAIGAGRMTRRQVLSFGLRAGLASSAIVGLMALAPDIAAGPAPATPRRSFQAQEGSGALTVVIGGSAPDLDPHYAYDNLASMLFLGAYEMLIQYKGETTDEYEPMLALSWESNEDGSS